ncbi:MAG: hypothetical protein ABW199_11275, partial [Caulobacterales bacterium]
ALLSSLTLLVGVIFRPRIGDYIDTHSGEEAASKAGAFHDVFIFATWVGMIAVVLCFIEWYRQRKPPAFSADTE